MTLWFQNLLGEGFGWLVATVILILLIVLPLLLGVAFSVYADRKIWAAMQMRRGPNVVGPWGILQSFADGLKLFLKETIIPRSEEHTSELQSLMRISYAVFCLKKKTNTSKQKKTNTYTHKKS